MSQKTTRRHFLKQTSALGAAWWVGTTTTFADSKSKIERLNFASIGVQGKGSSDSNNAGKHGNLIALCDIDDNRLNKKAKEFPKAKKYNDYRKMLEELESDIDVVTVSTPDHSHAPASVMAMKLGKHCFCQKPLTWSVHEARTMRQVAAEKKVATQMGNQGTATGLLREAVEMVRAGLIGNVTEVHVWTNRPIWPQGTGRPTDTPPVPPNVHWNLWLGPAPERPYHPAYLPFKWRGWVDFGTGALGDMACHTMNMPVMACNLFEPISVEADSPGIFENETYPKFSTIRYEFGKRGDLAPCTMYWYDGGRKPPAELLKDVPAKDDKERSRRTRTGSLLIGDKGALFSQGDYGGQGNYLLPVDKFADVKKPEPTLPRTTDHFLEFVTACKGGPAAMSNFGYAGRLTETVLLGDVAMRAGTKIEWDAKSMKVTNLPAANQFIQRKYRQGWTL